MKNRSHRPPMFEPHHDDWVDGSWTVDCICGVNFDDGEEMVDCDECGVWVHTRCSGYVKGERSFSCDKCRSKKSVGRGSSGLRNDSEETEVAEFLVELPTKAMLETPHPVGFSSRRSFRLWTEIPMDERVHVQGVPGGESGFFARSKMSSIIGPELWKCTGYVPKKFNFRYTEFPWLDHGKFEEMNRGKGERNVDQVNSGSGVLFSLSNEDINPFIDLMTVSKSVDVALSIEAVSPTQKKKSDGENLDSSCFEKSFGKETISVPITLNSSKRKKEQSIMLSDRGPKKLRTGGKEGDTDDQAAGSKAGSLEVSSLTLGECSTNLALKERNLDPLLGIDASSHDIWSVEGKGAELSRRLESSSKSNCDVKSIFKLPESWSMPVRKEVDSRQNCVVVRGSTENIGIGSLGKEMLAGCSTIGVSDAEKTENDQKFERDMATTQHNKKPKCEAVDTTDERSRIDSLPHNEMNLDSMKAITQHPKHCGSILSELVKLSEKLTSPKSIVSKLFYASEDLTVDDFRTDNTDQSPAVPYGPKIEPTISEVSLGPRKEQLIFSYSSGVPDEMLRVDATSKRNSTCKMVGASMKSVSSSVCLVSKLSDNHGAMVAHSRQKELMDGSAGSEKEDTLADTVEYDAKSGRRPRNFVKEFSGLSSSSEMPDSAEASNLSNCSTMCTDEKDFRVPSCSRTPQMPNISSVCVSLESGRQPLGEVRSTVKCKYAASSAYSKGERARLLDAQTSSRGNVNFAPTSSNVSSALSDEELALLLHQELNSSPRVPRVPRIRNAGSIVQLTCSRTMSMPMKRTSSGGKDQCVSYRRKSKDFLSDGSDGYLVTTHHEAKKTERKPSSSDDSRQDSACSAYQLSQKETDCGSTKNVHSMKKTYVSSCLASDAYEQNLAFKCPSASNASEDGPHKGGNQAHRTLPGVIAEIMSEGKHMTYEELCNAVLPHWPHLRKQNGERYAYSSHSQAVLDCLRNRSEWARLVDRGPKTNACRKRRKNDADSLSMESEDIEENIEKSGRDAESKSIESHPEDIPKGKRKARKRKCVAAQEGCIMKGRRTDIMSDEESDSSYSGCSEDDDVSSEEEETQGEGGGG